MSGDNLGVTRGAVCSRLWDESQAPFMGAACRESAGVLLESDWVGESFWSGISRPGTVLSQISRQ